MAEERETQETLRDTIAGAFEEHQEPAPAAAVADTRSSERVRAEDGKFAKAEKAEKPSAPLEPEKVERPSTWKKDYWEKYDSLDPDLRKYILQRENEYKAGLSTYNGEVKAAQSLKGALEPFMPALQRNNIDPAQFVRNLAGAHHTLAEGTPEQKAQMFMRMANDYGVDLRGLVTGQQGDPQLQYLSQNLQGLQQQWQQFQSQQQAEQQAAIIKSIEEFKSDAAQHPHFDAVRETMAGLLRSGMSQSLQDAYDKAIYMSPEVRTEVLAAQQQRDQAGRLEQQAAAAKRARANAVSPRSSTPAPVKEGVGKKGLREMLSEGFDGASGRV